MKTKISRFPVSERIEYGLEEALLYLNSHERVYLLWPDTEYDLANRMLKDCVILKLIRKGFKVIEIRDVDDMPVSLSEPVFFASLPADTRHWAIYNAMLSWQQHMCGTAVLLDALSLLIDDIHLPRPDMFRELSKDGYTWQWKPSPTMGAPL